MYFSYLWDFGTIAFAAMICLLTAAAYYTALQHEKKRKSITFYNVIFPIWFLMFFFPPVVFITLGGNWVIDSLVLIVCYFVYKLAAGQNSLKDFYRKSILKVWLFGFLADFIGAAILLAISFFLDLPSEINYAVEYNPFSHSAGLIIVGCAMVISAFLIFLFNYRISLKHIEEKGLRFKVALTIAIITMPWTFLIPNNSFYQGM